MASSPPTPPPGPPYAAPPPPPQWPAYQAPPGGSWPAAPPPAPKTNRTVLIVVVAVVVVVLLVIVIGAAALHSNGSPSAGGPPPGGPTNSQTLVSSGQVWQIPASHYEYVGPFTLSSSATITGVFTATGSGANAFILTPTEQQSFGSGSSSTPSSYVWTSGAVTTGSANTNLAAGTYYIDFVNQDSFSTTSVQVTSAFVATF